MDKPQCLNGTMPSDYGGEEVSSAVDCLFSVYEPPTAGLDLNSVLTLLSSPLRENERKDQREA